MGRTKSIVGLAALKNETILFGMADQCLKAVFLIAHDVRSFTLETCGDGSAKMG